MNNLLLWENRRSETYILDVRPRRIVAWRWRHWVYRAPKFDEACRCSHWNDLEIERRRRLREPAMTRA